MSTKPETEEEEIPARIICIEIEGLDETAIDRVAKEIEQLVTAAIEGHDMAEGIEFVGTSVEDPAAELEDGDHEDGDGV